MSRVFLLVNYCTMGDVKIIPLGGKKLHFINNMCKWLRPLKAVCMLCDYAIFKNSSTEMDFQLPNDRKNPLIVFYKKLEKNA